LSHKPVVLDWCSAAAARYAVGHWHYSRSLPPPPHNAIGVWENRKYIGCVLFARGANKDLFTPYGVAITGGCELVRVALDTHETPVSRIVTIAIKLLRARSPGLRLILSFADPHYGHHGGIYQALGWVYLGTTSPASEYIGPNGKRWHPRMISPSGIKRVYGQYRRVLRPDQCTRVARPGKHRYALGLDDAMRASLRPLARPYPKRGRSAENGTAAPTAGGGEIPTRPLQP
jgi:hypothetical protein